MANSATLSPLDRLVRTAAGYETWTVPSDGPLDQAMRQYTQSPPGEIAQSMITDALGYLPFGRSVAALGALGEHQPNAAGALVVAAMNATDPSASVLTRRLNLLERAELIDQVFGIEHLSRITAALESAE